MFFLHEINLNKIMQLNDICGNHPIVLFIDDDYNQYILDGNHRIASSLLKLSVDPYEFISTIKHNKCTELILANDEGLYPYARELQELLKEYYETFYIEEYITVSDKKSKPKIVKLEKQIKYTDIDTWKIIIPIKATYDIELLKKIIDAKRKMLNLSAVIDKMKLVSNNTIFTRKDFEMYVRYTWRYNGVFILQYEPYHSYSLPAEWYEYYPNGIIVRKIEGCVNDSENINTDNPWDFLYQRYLEVRKKYELIYATNGILIKDDF